MIGSQPDGHQQMAMSIHKIFSQDGGVPISSAISEQVSEMKMWLGAIAGGQLKVVDTAEEKKEEGDGAETPQD